MPIFQLETKASKVQGRRGSTSPRGRRGAAAPTPGMPADQAGRTGKIRWPEGRRFVFTVFDDTDQSTLENTEPVYAFLRDLGFRTTKSVWPIAGRQEPMLGGSTCEDDEYRRWLLELKADGFEIALHSATYHSSPRADTIQALDRFQEIFGADPVSLAIHTSGHWSLVGVEGGGARAESGVSGAGGGGQGGRGQKDGGQRTERQRTEDRGQNGRG